jgi:hypothetical protein
MGLLLAKWSVANCIIFETEQASLQSQPAWCFPLDDEEEEVVVIVVLVVMVDYPLKISPKNPRSTLPR